MKVINKLVLPLIVCSNLLAGGGVGGGATEITQLLNNTELGAIYGKEAAQYSKQLQQYATQVQQFQTLVQQYQNQLYSYEMMLNNIRNLPTKQWGDFTNLVYGLRNVVNYGKAISYSASNYDTLFSQRYQGYDTYKLNALNKEYNFMNEYKEITTGTRDSVNGALKALNLQEEDLINDQAVMQELQNVSMSADGQKAAIQAANSIALHQTQTLKKLQRTIMIQSNVQSNYIAAQNEAEELRQANSKAFTENADLDPIPSDDGNFLTDTN